MSNDQLTGTGGGGTGILEQIFTRKPSHINYLECVILKL